VEGNWRKEGSRLLGVSTQVRRFVSYSFTTRFRRLPSWWEPLGRERRSSHLRSDLVSVASSPLLPFLQMALAVPLEVNHARARLNGSGGSEEQQKAKM
jgi:hypothetical protein